MDGPATSARISRWGVVVMVSALLIVGGAAALAIASVTSSHERMVSFAVRGSLSGVALDVDDADVLIAGGGQRSVLGVQRTDRFAFGHDAEVQRSVAGDELRIRSRCPNAVPRACSVRYRVVVPDNVPVTVRTAGGDGALPGLPRLGARHHARGDIDIAGFCGFSLQARAESGDIAASAACAPQQLTLRSTQGSVRVSRAAGPLPGRGRERVGRPPRPRPRRGVRRAVRDPGAEQLGRRDGGGPSVIAALELDRRLERAASAAAYLVVNVPIAILGAISVLALVARRRAERRLDRAAAAARRGGRVPLARPARPPGGQPLPGHAHPARAGRRAVGRQSVAALARRPLRPRPVADGGASWPRSRCWSRGCASSRSCRWRCSRRSSASACRASAAWGRSTTWDRGRSGSASASCCWRWPRPPRCWWWRRSTRSTRCCAPSAARCWPRAPRRAGPVREMLAESLGDRSVAIAYWLARPRGLRRRGGPPRRAAGARIGARVDRGRAGRAPRGGDRPRRGAGHQPRARPRRRGGVVAGHRQRAPEGGPARARGGPARVAPADRRGRRRGAAAHRARPPRRRPAAAARARPRAARAAFVDQRSGGRAAGRRARRCAWTPR